MKYLSVVYISTATMQFSTPELKELLDRSRANNERVGVSGMLLHDDGNFMQVIEGPHDVVRDLHQRIMSDRRHGGVITLLEQEVDDREFGDWRMGFRDLSTLKEEERAGYSGILNGQGLSQDFTDNPGRATTLLLSFKSGLRTG